MNTYQCDICKAHVNHKNGIPTQGKLTAEFLGHTIDINIGIAISEKSAGVSDSISGYSHIEGSALCYRCLHSAINEAIKQKTVTEVQSMEAGQNAKLGLTNSQTMTLTNE